MEEVVKRQEMILEAIAKRQVIAAANPAPPQEK